MAHAHGAHHAHHAHHAPSAADADPDALAAMLDLETEVFADHWTASLDAAAHALDGAADARLVLDLGAGTGTGAVGLAERLPTATVLALDSDEAMLARVRERAAGHGVADHVRTVHADLDADWPDPGGAVDLVWAAKSMHHLAEPDRVLAEIRSALRAGGVLAVVEFDEAVRFLPDAVGDGLEARCLAAIAAQRAHDLPELGSDWPARLTAAGFTVLDHLTHVLRAEPPYPPSLEPYARGWLERMRAAVADELDDADRAALDDLIDAGGLHRLAGSGGLRVHGERTMTIARR